MSNRVVTDFVVLSMTLGLFGTRRWGFRLRSCSVRLFAKREKRILLDLLWRLLNIRTLASFTAGMLEARTRYIILLLLLDI
ncbi:uncharacterized protein LOC126682782 isoform X2 [Mercurialis annua]|uniref:uncharacterized protein LOC126682782 isoform X2 n=1 Tax=Mercurialis annua TaxID=3986 RepID=UPI0024ACFAFB|nr:uncharacterized protein LOC126682782 isoform X2 [Mercurialis annua]